MRGYAEDEDEKPRAVNLLFESHMTLQQVVEKLEFPARRRLERYTSADSRHHAQIFKRDSTLRN